MDELFERLMKEVRICRREGCCIYLCGNGGSAANAMHVANDLLACGVRAHALTANIAIVTAIANDYGYEKVFSKQLEVLGQANDLLIAFSGSGRSPNVLKAVDMALELGMRLVKVFGNELGLTMHRSEELQIEMGHRIVNSLLLDAVDEYA